MRTTVEINDELLREAKRRASDEGTTLRAIFERALRMLLGKQPSRSPYRLRWRAERGRRKPDVDVADRDALLDRMEGRR